MRLSYPSELQERLTVLGPAANSTVVADRPPPEVLAAPVTARSSRSTTPRASGSSPGSAPSSNQLR